MLWKILLFMSHLYCSWCKITYELNVQGEAQHGYYITVNIGYPPQNTKLLIDTGSANFAVAVTPSLKGTNNFFHYTDSDTFKKLSSNIQIQYIQGNSSGFLATDFVSVSKNESVRLAIACMTSVQNVFDINSMFAGILGLAYPALAKPNSSILPFFDTIRKAKKVNNVFSLSLCGPSFSSTSTHTPCGKLHLGFISSRHYTDKIIYSPIIKEQLYEITLTMIKVGSEQIAVDCKELNDPMSFVDTGTTQLLVSSSVYHEIVSKIKIHVIQLQSQLNITGDIHKFWLNATAACIPKKYFNISFFPNLSISFYHTHNSSFNLVLSPELYLLPWQEFSNENTCFTLGIGISNVGTIIGSTLLKGYYVIFDRSNKQIGFANTSSSKREMKLTSLVTVPYFLTDANYSNCKHVKNSSVQNDLTAISAGTILSLLLILMLTGLLLYKIILWVQANRLHRSDNRSDTSSLVGEEYKI